MARFSKEKQDEIRNKIKSVARKRFDEIGFEEVSTKQIAKEAGIAEGTLFNYFDSKADLFIEVFAEGYSEHLEKGEFNEQFGTSVGELLISHFQSMFSYMLKLPRKLFGELVLASVKMARKKPERFKKLAQYDFQFMDEVSDYIRQLVDKKLMEDVDEKKFSEIIFGIIVYELIMYVYDHEVKKEMVMQNIKDKVDILVKGYLRGGE